ncbi:MAG: T9SS type A sorting domain-containing protein, partial [Sphingobacteriales bacterium]
MKKSAANLVISPNPFRGKLNINVDWKKNETATIKILNVNGVEIITKKVALTQG